MLPKTVEQISNGSIHIQRVRCGKANCKCKLGNFHLAFYFFSRINGKFHKFYIRKSELKHFALLVETATMQRKRNRILRNNSSEMFRQFSLTLRENS